MWRIVIAQLHLSALHHRPFLPAHGITSTHTHTQTHHSRLCPGASARPALPCSRFGPPTKLHQAAASRFAGSWLALHKAKVLAARDAEPWRTPCDAELRAALAAMLEAPAAGAGAAGMTAAAAPAARQPAAPAAGEEQEGAGVAGSNDATELAVVFLVDGSGSVGEDDFSAMTGFLATAAQAAGALPHSKVRSRAAACMHCCVCCGLVQLRWGAGQLLPLRA